MKKFFIVCISAIIIIAIMFMPGCGGGGGGVKSLKVYQTSGSGGIVQMDLVFNPNIVYAASLEINGDYILCMNGITIPSIDSYVEDGGSRLTDFVDIVTDFSESGYRDCVNVANINHLTQGGVTADLYPTLPGKVKLISTGGGYTKTIEVTVFDGQAVPPGGNNGYRVDNDGHYLSGTKAECAFWSNPTPFGSQTILPGKSYKFNTGTPEDWYSKMFNMKTVDVDQVNAGSADQILNVGDMYIEEVPGGYVKICKIQGEGYAIWEFTSTTNFR